MLCSRCSPLRFFVNGTVRAQVRSPLCGFPHALLRNFPGEPRAARSVRWVLSQTAPFRCPWEAEAAVASFLRCVVLLSLSPSCSASPGAPLPRDFVAVPRAASLPSGRLLPPRPGERPAACRVGLCGLTDGSAGGSGRALGTLCPALGRRKPPSGFCPGTGKFGRAPAAGAFRRWGALGVTS